MAAYHEDNADRMGKAAPNLIPVLVSLMTHPDPEVQVHAATALANLAHGSPSYQSEAGEVGAIGALLDVCCGRAGVGRIVGGAGGDGEGDSRTAGIPTPALDGGAEVEVVEQGDRRQQVGPGGVGGRLLPSKTSPNGKKDLDVDRSHIKADRRKVQQEVGAEEEEKEDQSEDKSGKGDRWARKRGSGREQGTSGITVAISPTDEVCAVKEETLAHHISDDRTNPKYRDNRRASDEEGGSTHLVKRSGREEERNVDYEGVEEAAVADTMDVDAVQAATAALANLLCYSETNSVRLVAAGGIGILVGLVSSYRPHNLLDSDQVCDRLPPQLRELGRESVPVEPVDENLIRVVGDFCFILAILSCKDGAATLTSDGFAADQLEPVPKRKPF